MKKLMLIMIGIICWGGAVHAAGCPAGFEEIPLENIVVTDASCDGITTTAGADSDFVKYYDIPQQCTANILD